MSTRNPPKITIYCSLNNCRVPTVFIGAPRIDGIVRQWQWSCAVSIDVYKNMFFYTSMAVSFLSFMQMQTQDAVAVGATSTDRHVAALFASLIPVNGGSLGQRLSSCHVCHNTRTHTPSLNNVLLRNSPITIE